MLTFEKKQNNALLVSALCLLIHFTVLQSATEDNLLHLKMYENETDANVHIFLIFSEVV